MRTMGGTDKHLGGMHAGDNGRSGSFPNNATQRGGLSRGGVNKDLGGGAVKADGEPLGAGKANDGNPGRQSSSGKSRAPVQRG